jgi:hypothetical protein
MEKGTEVTSKPAVIYLPDPNMPIAPYMDPISQKVFGMTTEEDGERTKPFMQRVQLAGNATVRATGQVDDGAMVNCLAKAKWQAYNVCLGTLLPSTKVIGVANNQRIRSMGRW